MKKKIIKSGGKHFKNLVVARQKCFKKLPLSMLRLFSVIAAARGFDKAFRNSGSYALSKIMKKKRIIFREMV